MLERISARTPRRVRFEHIWKCPSGDGLELFVPLRQQVQHERCLILRRKGTICPSNLAARFCICLPW